MYCHAALAEDLMRFHGRFMPPIHNCKLYIQSKQSWTKLLSTCFVCQRASRTQATFNLAFIICGLQDDEGMCLLFVVVCWRYLQKTAETLIRWKCFASKCSRRSLKVCGEPLPKMMLYLPSRRRPLPAIQFESRVKNRIWTDKEVTERRGRKRRAHAEQTQRKCKSKCIRLRKSRIEGRCKSKCKQMQEQVQQQMQKHMQEQLQKQVQEHMQKQMQEQMQKATQEHMQKQMQKQMQEQMQKATQEHTQEQMQEQTQCKSKHKSKCKSECNSKCIAQKQTQEQMPKQMRTQIHLRWQCPVENIYKLRAEQ